MDALSPIVSFLNTVVAVLRPTVFALGAVTGAAAVASWAVRTRRIGPFTAFARITRRSVDPLFLPAERRVVRAGGTPASAPWWTVAAVVLGGLLVLALLEFLTDQVTLLAAMSYQGPRGILLLIVKWALMLLKVAIIARVISSWVGGNQYSRWWRWSFQLTEWFFRPLRRVLPTFGPLDLSPLVAYFGLVLLESLIVGVL